jgi:dihydrolipoamide dehydrogenase
VRKYDVIVIGSGAGGLIVEQALTKGLRVAWVDKGPLGGTCLNVGCIPSKMVIFPADRIMEIREAGKLGIKAEIGEIDFEGILERTRNAIAHEREHMRDSIYGSRELDFYEDTGSFVGNRTMDVSGLKIKGEKIYIASGARPLIPPVQGLENVDYLTNDNVFELRKRPESLLIVGGGYIAVEFGHFFSAMGTKVTIVQRGGRLVKEEEPEISALLKKEMQKRMEIHTGTEVLEAGQDGGLCRIIGRERETGETREFTGERVLICAGRTSNADLLHVEETGVDTDDRGYIVVNDYYETTRKGIWAFGDAIGRKMFRHSANQESLLAWKNSMNEEKETIDYQTVPHAVFSYPEIASVGLREAEAKEHYEGVLVGTARYRDVARGEAMMEDEAFAKMILEKGTGRILGCHIIGPQASILIQEVINAMTSGGYLGPVISGMHIHPALTELIHATLRHLHEV